MTQPDTPKAPDRDQVHGEARLALLMIDLVNDFDFPGGKALHDRACAIVEPLLRLRAEVEAAGWPVIYVNDNFGEWHSERSRLVERAIEAGSNLSKRLAPDDADYFIIKPQFSGFYSTNLAVLLPKLGVRRLILAGVATEVCILFTAGDAHMRDYALWVPSDLVASSDRRAGEAALAIVKDALGAETAPTSRLSLRDWMAAVDRRQSG